MANASSAAVQPQRAVLNLRALGVSLGAGLATALLAFASGGYYPTAWGWGALIALWLVATYLVVGTVTRPGTLALVFLGALGLLTAWTWLSLAWSDDVDQTVLEGQRMLLYLAAAAAVILLVRRDSVTALLGGAATGIVLVSGYALATRLFPDRLGVFEPTGGYRLSEPFYWNALGVFSAIGALLALGFALRGSFLARALAAATLPMLLTTTYFTFSRGAWVAFGIGLLAAIALDPRRLQLLAGGLALAPASALAVWLASRQDALTRTDAPLSAATREGHRLALYVALLACVSALVGAAFAAAEARLQPSRAVRGGFAVAVVLVAVAVLGTVFVRYGDPITLAEKGWDAFASPPPPDPQNLGERLFTFTGSYRVDFWEIALDDYADHPVLGSGAGSYEHYWNEHRPFAYKVRDAHSLFLESLAELGPLGLIALLLAVGVPFAAAFLARGHPLTPAALGGFVAYLVHAGIDWDWELAAVTLTGLACGIALIAAAAHDEDRRLLPPAARAAGLAGVLLLGVVAFVGLVGASALSASETAFDKGRYGEAEDEARKASRWWRWSPQPWTRLGEAQLEAGDRSAARESFRKATDKDRRDWLLWYDLASVSEGAEARRALAEAGRLNPFYRDDLAEEPADVPS
jgi:tetratricopeptide (TPR) repeat protein